MLYCFSMTTLLLLPITFVTFVESRIVQEPKLGNNECSPQMNQPLQEVAEKICELCHEFHNHEVPNMRAECRAQCFSTDKFRMCMRMFTNSPKRHNRHSRRHVTSIF